MPNLRKLLLTSFAVCLFCLSGSAVKADPVFFDPTGDTFGVGPVKPDITSANGTIVGSNLIFRLTFAATIAAPSALASNSVIGFIDIDTDQNRFTGAIPFQQIFGP